MEPILPAENVSHATQFKHGITTRYPNKCCRRISSGVLTTLMAHTTVAFGNVAFVQCGLSCKLFFKSQLSTTKASIVMCEVDSIFNSRWITFVSDDPADPEALTPNHLLLLKCDSPIPTGAFQKENVFSQRMWRQIQYLSDIFWKRWTRGYLPLLQSRQNGYFLAEISL